MIVCAPAPDAARAYAVLDWIEAHPDQHDQEIFASRSGIWFAEISLATGLCGTTGCFAGWTVLLAGYEIHHGTKVWDDGDFIGVDDAAARLLGLGTKGDKGAAWDLFYRCDTLEDVRVEVERIFGPRPTSEGS